MPAIWSTNPTDVVVGVIGVTGSGKSSFIKRVTKCADIIVGDGLESVTQDIAQYRLEHNGIRYVLVDTPGFDDSVRDDEDVYHDLAEWMERSYRGGQRMNGLIYLHPIISNRERGSEIRNLRMFKKLCGDDNFSNVILGLTFCDQEAEEIITWRQQQLTETPEWWGDMVARGSQVRRVFLEPEACLQLLSQFAPEAPFTYGSNNPWTILPGWLETSNFVSAKRTAKQKITLKIQSEVVEQGVSINDTEAAQTVLHKQELDAIRAREKRELAQLNAEFDRRMEVASAAYNQRMVLMMQKFESIRKRQELQNQSLRLQAQLNEELERKERILRDEERAREKAQADEIRQLKEMLDKTRLENDQIEKRSQTQREFAKIRPRLIKRWQTMKIEKEVFRDWEEAKRYQQSYHYEQADVDIGFCDACLKSVEASETHHMCADCNERGLGLGEDVRTFQVCLCDPCKKKGKVCWNSEHVGFKENRNLPIPRFENCKWYRKWGQGTACDECGNEPGDIFFHCCSCEMDNYDICIPCWGKGATCKNKKHTLRVVSRRYPPEL